MDRAHNKIVWDLRAHRSVMPGEVRQAVLKNEVGPGFANLRMKNPEAYVPMIEDGCARAANSCFASHLENGLFVNPHPVSGSVANLASLTALVQPGEPIVVFGARSISHFSLGGPLSLASRLYQIHSIEPQRDAAESDFLNLWQNQHNIYSNQPRLIAFGPTAYPCRVNWQALRSFADSFSPPAILLADISHHAGPIAAGLLESPCGVADVVTFTTYKSLCGPANAVIIARTFDLHDRIRKTLIPGFQDCAYLSSLEAVAASLSYALGQEFIDIQNRAFRLTHILYQVLVENGITIAFGGAHTHMLVVDLAFQSVEALEMCSYLSEYAILCDTVVLPGDPVEHPMGLRFGTIALAQMACGEDQFLAVASQVATLLRKGISGRILTRAKRITDDLPNDQSSGVDTAPNLPTSMTEGRPDEFMFRQFRRHSRVLRTPARYDYFMLSGGANLFPVSQIWKELLELEIGSDLAYGWYTSQEGVPTLQRAVSMWENYAASLGRFPEHKPLGSNVCMTLGASQAVAAVFDFVAHSHRRKTVLLLGHNYGLFERLAHHYDFAIHELLGEDDGATTSLPSADKVAHTIRTSRPAIIVLVVPNNPSGEQYNPEDISIILQEASCNGAIVLFDQVGQMPMAQDSWINIGEIVSRTGTQAHSVLVNSFSKSDAVPGFRIGYMLAPEIIARHASKYQLMSTMNPPTVPLIPPFFSLLARCVYSGEKFKWCPKGTREKMLSFALHMFEVTTAISPTHLIEEVSRRLSNEGFDRDYELYKAWHKEVGDAIRQNHSYVLERLTKYVTRTTNLRGGFNFLIELEPFENKDEDEICRTLFDKTAVAILTESCFRVSRRLRRNFWVRISLAAPPPRFQRAVDRLAEFIEKV